MVGHDAWSAQQSTSTVSVDGRDLEVAFYEDGPIESEAPPVVFVHGIPTWSFLWRDVAPAIADDRRTVAPDMLGYGNSAMSDDFDRSIRAQEEMLEGLLDELGLDRVALVGHDIGGGVALRLAAHNPDLVDRLVLSNAVCYDSWPVEFVANLGLPSTADAEREELDARLDAAFVDGAYGEVDPEFVDGMKAPWLTDEGHVSLVRNAVATNTNHTTELEYGAITADTLLLWGEDDVMQPYAFAERLADDIESAELAPLSEAYHWVPEDRSDAYVDRLREFVADGAA